jgi:hypothetical protein
MGELEELTKEEESGEAYELIDLQVREVSLVDTPAIGRTFLVSKREEEDEMVKGKRVAKQNGETETRVAPQPEANEKTPAGEEEATPPEGEPTPEESASEPKPAPAADPVPASAPEGDEVEVQKEPEPLTVDGALIFLKEAAGEEPTQAAKAALSVLERQLAPAEEREKQEGVDPTDFQQTFEVMSAPSQIWAAFDALMSVTFSILDSTDEEKLDKVAVAVEDFKSMLIGLLGQAGVKSDNEPEAKAEEPEPEKAEEEEPEAAEPGTQRMKLGEEEMEVEGDPFQIEVLAAMAELAERVADIGERLEVVSAGGSVDKAAREEPSEPEPDRNRPVTAAEVMKIVASAISEAKKPRYKSLAVREEDTQIETENREEPVEPGTYRTGMAGMERKVIGPAH